MATESFAVCIIKASGEMAILPVMAPSREEAGQAGALAAQEQKLGDENSLVIIFSQSELEQTLARMKENQAGVA